MDRTEVQTQCACIATCAVSDGMRTYVRNAMANADMSRSQGMAMLSGPCAQDAMSDTERADMVRELISVPAR